MEKNRCKFWLHKKNRFCANAPLNDSQFCGNHKPRSVEQWIQCPIDPSHSVLKENVEGHLKRCPLLKQAQSLSLQQFYHKAINAGKEEEDNVTSEQKRCEVYGMTVPEFYKLINKIESVHASICKDIQESYKVPGACSMWTKRKLPFQEKHVVQQLPILWNLEDFGVIKSLVGCKDAGSKGLSGANSNCVPAVVEFGAGRGYLTEMLVDCHGIQRVFLVERKSYKLKADRSLRQMESLTLERLRIDRGVPYLAVGKHLCGSATDLTLRCCLAEQCSQDGVQECSNGNLKGLAIATCCHHLCLWSITQIENSCPIWVSPRNNFMQ